ncbi:MAG TPA: hypothetical protein VJR89_40430 [Polyangiales bacterium]|nr:hypothetical protein [Polyangiales bacterium]
MLTTKLKPLAKASRHAVLKRRTAVQITRSLEEALFREADVLSEGGLRAAGPGQATYFGSTMIRVQFAALLARARPLGDRTERAELAVAIEGSVRIRLRAMRLARAEAARRMHRSVLGTALCEIRVCATADQLHIDVDLEVPVRVSSRAKGT